MPRKSSKVVNDVAEVVVKTPSKKGRPKKIDSMSEVKTTTSVDNLNVKKAIENVVENTNDAKNTNNQTEEEILCANVNTVANTNVNTNMVANTHTDIDDAFNVDVIFNVNNDFNVDNDFNADEEDLNTDEEDFDDNDNEHTEEDIVAESPNKGRGKTNTDHTQMINVSKHVSADRVIRKEGTRDRTRNDDRNGSNYNRSDGHNQRSPTVLRFGYQDVLKSAPTITLANADIETILKYLIAKTHSEGTQRRALCGVFKNTLTGMAGETNLPLLTNNSHIINSRNGSNNPNGQRRDIRDIRDIRDNNHDSRDTRENRNNRDNRDNHDNHDNHDNRNNHDTRDKRYSRNAHDNNNRTTSQPRYNRNDSKPV
jgi:hypothetical protein